MWRSLFTFVIQSVTFSVSACAFIKWRNTQGQCAVQIALEMGKAKILEYFLKMGVDISKRPNLTVCSSGSVSFCIEITCMEKDALGTLCTVCLYMYRHSHSFLWKLIYCMLVEVFSPSILFVDKLLLNFQTNISSQNCVWTFSIPKDHAVAVARM
jgi:hypothetical protein